MISLCPRVRFPFLSRLCQNYLGNENRTQGYEVLTEMCAYQAGKYPEFRIPEQFRFEFRLRICPNNGAFRPENPAIRGIPVFRGISFRCDGQIDRNRKRKKHPRSERPFTLGGTYQLGCYFRPEFRRSGEFRSNSGQP